MLFDVLRVEGGGVAEVASFRPNLLSALTVVAAAGAGRYEVASDCRGVVLTLKVTARGSHLLGRDIALNAELAGAIVELGPTAGDAVCRMAAVPEPSAPRLRVYVSAAGFERWRAQQRMDRAGSPAEYRKQLEGRR